MNKAKKILNMIIPTLLAVAAVFAAMVSNVKASGLLPMTGDQNNTTLWIIIAIIAVVIIVVACIIVKKKSNKK